MFINLNKRYFSMLYLYYRLGCPETSVNLGRVTYQKSEDLIYTSAESLKSCKCSSRGQTEKSAAVSVSCWSCRVLFGASYVCSC
jgi:hypothetical protein